jgi:hypothetical protein
MIFINLINFNTHELVGTPAGQPNPGFGWDASFALNGRQVGRREYKSYFIKID